ncbi:MAG TPA: NAD(P)(+) transhydrogenase (Re/Si-specific) subunit alpha, partial [Steroidobacteraceae bacterium]|nr:NAD(P)(+) transhydrogenase (Re/Si-specific) subunit alpha [Steroidobacteraceae bacterium]
MSVVAGILRETAAKETRVAVVPEIATKLKSLGVRVLMERGAGASAHFPDASYTDAEFSDASTILASADILLKVQPPSVTEVAALKKGAIVIGFMQAYARPDLVLALKERDITSFAMELVPRISRAQSMDALSSQASVAGYKAVLIAANTLEKFLPMLTTAAGTIRPASVLVIGAGVAGLQAIATAKRLGAVVEAYDVRSATKDQVKSLGAKFVETGVSA